MEQMEQNIDIKDLRDFGPYFRPYFDTFVSLLAFFAKTPHGTVVRKSIVPSLKKSCENVLG
jgi:hypothetical protein